MAIVGTMFGHDKRLRLGQIKYLTDAIADASCGSRPTPHVEQAGG